MALNIEMADALAQTAVDFCCAWNITMQDANAKATALLHNIEDRVKMVMQVIYRNDTDAHEKTLDEVSITILRMATALMIARKISPKAAADLAVIAIKSAVELLRDPPRKV